MSTAKRIVELRESKGITQKEFAESVKINRSVVNRIEKGTRPVRDDELKQIAKYFNVSIDYLLDNDGDSGKAALNAEQAALIAEYDALNDEGRRTLQSILSSLRLTHGRSGKSSALPSYMPVNARMTAAVARN